MRSVTFYECEICGKTYRDVKKAERCEARGSAADLGLPVGFVFAVYHTNEMSIHRVAQVSHEGHELVPFCQMWHPRFDDKVYNDQLFVKGINRDSKVNSRNLPVIVSKCELTVAEIKSVEFRRLVAFIQKNKLALSFSNGQRIVTIEDTSKFLSTKILARLPKTTAQLDIF